MKDLRIVFFGTDSFVIPVLETLEKNFNLVGIITVSGSAVARAALAKQGLPLLEPANLKKLHPDLIVLASYGKMIPQSILDIPKYGALNVHPSLLPKYRGPAPVPATILNGDEVAGVSIMLMDEKMDHGPILNTKVIPLSGQEDFPTLINKLFREGAQALVSTIPDFIAGKIKPREQDHSLATFTKMMSKEDGYFDISSPPDLEKLDRMIRAYHPWPGVWTKWNNKIVKFYPGSLVQMEGKKATKLEDFLNGYPNFPIKELKF